MRKLTQKESLDIDTMIYFTPHRAPITQKDRVAMADLSSRGIQPEVESKGFKALKVGKTYRDLQITSYRNDIKDGFFTKHEILSETPAEFRDWLSNKIKDVPYDAANYELKDGHLVLTEYGENTLKMFRAVLKQDMVK